MAGGKATLPSLRKRGGEGGFAVRVVCCLALLALSVDVTGALYEPYTQWTTAVRLEDYESYKDAQLLSFRIPLDTETIFWNLQAGASHTDCPHRTAKIFARWGSFPIITPYNESFPSNFHPPSPGTVYEFQVMTDNASVSVVMPQPRSGDWFLAAMLVRTTKKIAQKGLSETCEYGLTAIAVSKVVVGVSELAMERNHKVPLGQDTSRTFRFFVPLGVLSYTMKLDSCVVTVNGSAVPVSPCPLGLCLAEDSMPVQNTPPVNCSTIGNNCTLFVGSPLTLAWTYVQVTRLDPVAESSFSFTVHILPMRCKAVGQVVSMDLGNRDAGRKTDQSDEEGKTNSTGPSLHYSPSPGTNHSVNLHLPPSGSSLRWQPSGQPLPLMLVQRSELDLNDQATDRPHSSVVNFNLSGQTSPVSPGSPTLPEGVEDQCVAVVGLGRFRLAQQDFAARFLFPLPDLLPEPANLVLVADNVAIVTHFVLQSEDRGGTLKVSLELASSPSQNVSVALCLTAEQMVKDRAVFSCLNGVAVQVNSSSQTPELWSQHVFLPYPIPGTWYLALQSSCFSPQGPEPCQELPQVRFEVLLGKCVDGKCGDYGFCKEFISGTSIFSSCQCYGGWRGYGCTDGREAVGDGMVLVSVLLLTLSNLAFLPAVAVAVHRRYFTEALVYAYTMFFSTFYHACDTSHLHYYCMMKYDVLSFCDFFGSLMSLWVTLAAMARIPRSFHTILHMVGALGIAIGVEYDRHSLWAFLVPAVVGVAVMLTSWVVQCHRRRSCFPSRQRYLRCLLPGILLAGTGLVFFAFLETEDNYQYIHSAWHIAMATCILFLLPPRDAGDDKGSMNVPYEPFQTTVQGDSVPTSFQQAAGQTNLIL